MFLLLVGWLVEEAGVVSSGEGSTMRTEFNRPINMEHTSSNSDDDSHDSDEHVDEGVGTASDSSDSSQVHENTSRNEEAQDSDQSRDGSEAYSDSEDEDEEGEESHVPLQDRLKKKEERGMSLQAVRARKSRALAVASKQLDHLKKRKLEENDEGHDDVADKRKKKKSKHAPTEVSSKRSDFFKRGALKINESGIGIEVGAHRYKPLDPRISSLSGRLDEQKFEKNFAFIEELRNKEIEDLRKRVQAYSTKGNKGKKLRKRLGLKGGSLDEDQDRLRTLLNEKAALERKKLERAAKQSVKKRISEEVAQGKRGAYFLKRKEKKRLELEAKFEQIHKQGGDAAVQKLLTKKRRKNKSRDAGLFAK